MLPKSFIRIVGVTPDIIVVALACDLADGENAKLAAKYLVENIEARDGHLSTGFIGTKDLMPALAKIGRNPDTGLGAGDVA